MPTLFQFQHNIKKLNNVFLFVLYLALIFLYIKKKLTENLPCTYLIIN